MQPLGLTGTPTTSPTKTPAITALPPATPDSPEIDQARADLAQRLSVSIADIEVVSVQEITWSDSSMGCPQPGMDYLQVETPGRLIQLAYAGQTYNYHSGGGQPPFLCEQIFPS